MIVVLPAPLCPTISVSGWKNSMISGLLLSKERTPWILSLTILDIVTVLVVSCSFSRDVEVKKSTGHRPHLFTAPEIEQVLEDKNAFAG